MNRMFAPFIFFLCLPNYQAEEDWKGLQGLWLPSQVQKAGMPAPGEVLKFIQLQIDRQAYTVTILDKKDLGKLKIDTTKSPAWMDIIGEEGPNKGKLIKAIYELSGDTLKVCYALGPDFSRPTKFESNAETKWVLIVYQRSKP